MQQWFDQLIPAGAWHQGLTAGLELLAKSFAAAVLYGLVRWLGWRALRALFYPFELRSRREGPSSLARLNTLLGLARSTFSYAALFVTIVTLLSQAGINVSAILAGAGVAGLALGFGAQRLVRDVLSGFFILLEDQFRVGEMVTLVGGPGIPQFTGTVLEMGLRTTRLKDGVQRTVSLGNGEIVAVINHSRGPVTAEVEIGVDANAGIPELQAVLAALALPEELFAGPAELRGIASLDGSRVVLKIAAPAAPGRSSEAELALRRAAGSAIRQSGVELR